jgi:hypothetical protein
VGLHENYSADETPETGSNRAFGCIVGAISMAIGAVKAGLAAALTPVAFLLLVAGAGLLIVGIVAPARLSALNRLWLRLGGAMAKVVNPLILALLFILLVTPLALVMRLIGKRPLRLAPDRAAASYWIAREPADGHPSNMTRQF